MAHLLLEGAGNEAAEFTEAVVDSVAAPFLDDLREAGTILLRKQNKKKSYT